MVAEGLQGQECVHICALYPWKCTHYKQRNSASKADDNVYMITEEATIQPINTCDIVVL